MSKVFAEYSSTITTHSAHYTFVAAAEMGYRHSRTNDNCTRKLQICSGDSRIFYKVDRGEASSKLGSSRTEKIFLAEYNMPF
jgi:hypothetical protein